MAKREVFLPLKIPNELRWLASQIRPFIPWHIASFLSVTVASLLALLSPLVLKWLIDQVLPRKETAMLLAAAVAIFLSCLGRSTLTSFGNYLTVNAVQKMALHLRMDFLRHLDRLSADYYDNTPAGVLMYPLKDPIEEVSYFGSDLLPSILHMCLSTVFTLTAMFLLSPGLSVAMLAIIPLFLIARQHFRRILSCDSDDVQRKQGAWNGFLVEHISSILPIQLLGRERQQERRAFRLLALSLRSQLKLFQTGVRFTLWTSIAVVLAMSAVIAYGGWRTVCGQLSVGGLVAFYSFVIQLFDPLSGAAELYTRAQRTFAGIRQLHSVWKLRPTVTDASVGESFPYRNWVLEFKDVEFGYKQPRQLLIPDLRIATGEKVAIVGENGAGKSTLAKLVTRLYDVDKGTIQVGGVDIRNIHLKDLRAHTCYLPRDPVLFDGTLASNLRFVRPEASDSDLMEAIMLTDLADVVTALPCGLHQHVGPNGCQLSGGQRQRLAIARAMLQRPCILILDEATSCLDLESESLLLRNLQNHLPASTLILVTHRFSALPTCERILVLSHGRVLNDFAASELMSAPRAHCSRAYGICADLGELTYEDSQASSDRFAMDTTRRMSDISRQLSKSERAG